MSRIETLRSQRQQRFVLEYMKDHCGTMAAIRAGYSKRCARQQASTLLSNPNIRDVLSEMQAELASRLQVEAEDVLNALVVSIEGAREVKQFSAAIKGLRLLGDYLGMWNGNVEPTRSPSTASPGTNEEPVSDQEIILEFAEDVRTMAEQEGCLNAPVEEFCQVLVTKAQANATSNTASAQ
jgi:hypothetical protein